LANVQNRVNPSSFIRQPSSSSSSDRGQILRHPHPSVREQFSLHGTVHIHFTQRTGRRAGKPSSRVGKESDNKSPLSTRSSRHRTVRTVAMATCSSTIYPPAVIASVTKQMNEANEMAATHEIPPTLQLTPSMRASNMRDAMVSSFVGYNT
jgi:hypothetical protein